MIPTEEPAATRQAVLALDIGGTKIAGALVTATGECGPVRTVATPAVDGPAAILDAAAGLARTVLADASDAVVLRGVGLGAAGVVEPTSGVVVSATDHLRGWTGTDLVAGLAERLAVSHIPVLAQNDVHAHAAGEAWLGAAATASTALVAAVGTGIGGAVCLDGQVLAGRHGAAGHLGHVAVPAAAGLRCACGGTGHVEAIASGVGIADLYQRLRGGDDRERRNGGEVAALAATGDPVALEAITTAGSALGVALGGIANVVAPDVIVLAGSVTRAGEPWWRAVRTALAGELIPALAGIDVVTATLGDRAALVGAARRVWQEC